MEFDFTPEQLAFRKEVKAFFDANVTDGMVAEMQTGIGFGPLAKKLVLKLGAKGWLVPMLPKEYGGLGLSFMHKYFISEEMQYRFPEAPIMTGPTVVAPILVEIGTDAQKKEFIPRIASGEIDFALGYTEPEAGTDLAGLQIRAVEDGDFYVINGQKIYSSSAHYSEYHWLCARTEVTKPKHRGLTLFIVPFTTPGVTISPLYTMSGHRTNQVFYDNVRIPKQAMVGEKNRGWYHMMVAIMYERFYPTGGVERIFEELTKYVTTTVRNGRLLSKDPLVRQKVAELATELETVRCLSHRLAWLLNTKQVPSYQASMNKIAVGEFQQRLTYAALQIMGSAGRLDLGSKHAPMGGNIAKLFLNAAQRSITGGANEIQRNIIAQRGLGLPH